MARVSNIRNLNARRGQYKIGLTSNKKSSVSRNYHIKRWVMENKPSWLSYTDKEINGIVNKYGKSILTKVGNDIITNKVDRHLSRLANRCRKATEDDIINYLSTIRRNLPSTYSEIIFISEMENQERGYLTFLCAIIALACWFFH